MRANQVCLVLLVAFVLFMATGISQQAQAGLFDGILGKGIKILGVGLVLDKWGDDIDRFINRILGQKEARIEGETKVVELIRVGGAGGAVGAAQVMGASHRVKKVQAVAEVEIPFGRVRARAMLPVSTRKELTKSIRAVGGTGVSANIKFPL
jgi:hypothetical protein